MSGQWELVGKKKIKDNLPVKKPKVESKKAIPIPKVEDVLPSKEVKSLFASNKNKENRKPVEKVKVQENGTTKKVQKKPEKPQEPKAKPPKTIEGALKQINVDEFKALYDTHKNLFPEGPLIWLKELVQFLNHQVPVELLQDPTFSNKPDNYPLCAVPGPLRSVIEKSVKEAGPGNAQLFFDLSLTSMANDMGKNLSVFGYKLYIQYLAVTDPTLVVTNLSKHAILRNSYQNRQPIGLSILWAVGQAALKDFNVGLKVFQELMLPVIEMKNYSRYVVQYLISLINRHDKMHINHEQYLLVLDIAFANYKNFPSDLRKDMQQVVVKLESMLLSHRVTEKGHTYVEPLLKKMLSNVSKGYRNELCKVLSSILIQNQIAFSNWSKIYTRYLPQSAILLKYIGDNWSTHSKNFNKTVIRDLLDAFQTANDELLSKKHKEHGLPDAVTSVKYLKDQLRKVKMVSQQRSRRWKWYVLLIVAGYVIYEDTIYHGSWEKSITRRTLKNYGILNYANNAFGQFQEGLQCAHKHIDQQFPGYYEKSEEILQPYGKLFRDVWVIGCNNVKHLKEVAVTKYYPAVVSTIDTYAPGLYDATRKTIIDAWSTTVVYCSQSVTYLQKEVFVGQLSPENIQRVLVEAINTSQRTAAQCYNWIYEKVQSAIK